MELEFETIESKQMGFSIDVARLTLTLNQCCSETSPKILFQHYRPQAVIGLHGRSFYVSFVYLVSWLQTADGIPPSRALEINSFSMAILLPVAIAAGLLSDRFGRKPLLIVACVLGFVGAVPLFWLLNQPSALFAQFGQLGLVLIVGLRSASQCQGKWPDQTLDHCAGCPRCW